MSDDEIKELVKKHHKKQRKGGDDDSDSESDGEGPEEDKPAPDSLAEDDAVAGAVADAATALDDGATVDQVKDEAKRRAEEHLSDEDKERLANLSDDEIEALKAEAREAVEGERKGKKGKKGCKGGDKDGDKDGDDQ